LKLVGVHDGGVTAGNAAEVKRKKTWGKRELIVKNKGEGRRGKDSMSPLLQIRIASEGTTRKRIVHNGWKKRLPADKGKEESTITPKGR